MTLLVVKRSADKYRVSTSYPVHRRDSIIPVIIKSIDEKLAKEYYLSAFKEQVMRNKCPLAGCLVGVEFPSLYLVFLDLRGYLLVMVYLYAFIFFHGISSSNGFV